MLHRFYRIDHMHILHFIDETLPVFMFAAGMVLMVFMSISRQIAVRPGSVMEVESDKYHPWWFEHEFMEVQDVLLDPIRLRMQHANGFVEFACLLDLKEGRRKGPMLHSREDLEGANCEGSQATQHSDRSCRPQCCASCAAAAAAAAEAV